MDTYRLGEWIDQWFGFRDERLILADELSVDIEIRRRELELEYDQYEERSSVEDCW
jgi:hypothetical protein